MARMFSSHYHPHTSSHISKVVAESDESEGDLDLLLVLGGVEDAARLGVYRTGDRGARLNGVMGSSWICELLRKISRGN